ncbi:DUF3791 domain-containing protein [Clostridium sp. FP1]|nr:DUF3791 domain-containing protein [Clostridium sp. FP1]MBZ9634172.1 DUF3791 domain-containing protein [Clostridium sp. FP1]
MSSYLITRWRITPKTFIEKDEKYNILRYIRLCYEPFHLTGEEGIAEDIEEFIRERGGDI